MVRKALLLALTTGCTPLPTVPIVFNEINDERVPSVWQTDFLEPDKIFGPGASVGDVDGDGRPDLFVGGQTAGLYLNRPDARGFRFEPAPMPALDLVPIATAFGDFDRDGDLDLLVAGKGGARLLANDGAGHFTDVTAAAGIAGPVTDLGLSVAFGDLDGDGWLDLVVANYGLIFDKTQDQQASHLYLNRRDGSFAELLAPLDRQESKRRVIISAFADFDGDGRLDLYLSDDTEVFFLDGPVRRHDLVLLNRGLDGNGRPVLVESSDALGLANPRATMSALFGDAGNGWQVFFADVQAAWLYRSSSAGVQPYDNVSKLSGVSAVSGPNTEDWINWGGAFADLDGDGREDLLIGQGPIMPATVGSETLGPLLLRNRGDQFEVQRYAFGGPMIARAILMVDLDGDGDQDAILVPHFDRFRFFVNDTAPRRFLRVRLQATVSAPGAVGAVVTVSSGGQSQKRMRTAGGQPHSDGESVLDFALATDEADLTVTWPSGAVQSLRNVGAGLVTVTEPAFIVLSDARPPADGVTGVSLTVDAVAAALGKAGSTVSWTSPGLALDAICDATGVARFDLPPRTAAGPVQGSLTVDGRVLPAHPALDYR